MILTNLAWSDRKSTGTSGKMTDKSLMKGARMIENLEHERRKCKVDSAPLLHEHIGEGQLK